MGAMFLAMVWHARRRQTALDQVQRAADREREFVRDASHQLKTPITVARGFAELVRGAPVGADTARDIDIVIEELDRLGKVAGNMLLLTASEQADSLVKGPIDLEELIESAIHRWRPSARRVWRVEVRSAGTLEADRIRVDSVLDALIENAVRATDVNDSITLRAFADADVAVLEVTDSGTGIPADYRARVFDRFWSTSTVDNGRSKRGAGLGLAIVKGIVEAHGGSVSLRSALGQGTTFTLRIPGFRPLADRPEQPLAEQAVAAG